MTGSGEIRHPVGRTADHDPPYGAALQALSAGATLAAKSDGKDRANRQAGRERER
jgi:hypothetical protein